MLSKAFLSTISGFISEHSLLDKGKRYIVALSGGADSVALALALLRLGYKIDAAHCNFHLRGEESDRDERFCVSFCNENNIKLHIAHFDTISFARLRKISIEMAARNLRYSYFSQLLCSIGAQAVCVAHHRDDSVETVLMNLIRGTGIHGLTGISPKNGDVVRPLLCVSRKDIEAELGRAGQSFVTDSTNLVDDVVRNKIRLDILPLMREINPSVSESIAAAAGRVTEVARVFDTVIDDAVKRAVEYNEGGVMRLSVEALKACVSAENVLFRVLKDFSFNSVQTEQICRALYAEPGKVFYSGTSQLLVDRHHVIIEPLDYGLCRRMVMPEDGVYACGEKMKLKVERIAFTPDTEITKSSSCLCADLSKVSFPLTVRAAEPGDRFVPFGMRGSKLVSDFLTDKKLSLFDKRRQLVVTDSAGNIIWVVSHRADNRCRITPKTEMMLKITCISV